MLQILQIAFKSKRERERVNKHWYENKFGIQEDNVLLPIEYQEPSYKRITEYQRQSEFKQWTNQS